MIQPTAKSTAKKSRSAVRWLAALLVACGFACVQQQQPASTPAAAPPPPGEDKSSVQIHVHAAPPAPPAVVIPATPGPRYVWVEGYYRWDGSAFVWVDGSWQLPPPDHLTWHPGHWVKDGEDWVWEAGRWE